MATRAQKTEQVDSKRAAAGRGWYVVDLDGKTLGRAASKIAHVLRGKHKPTFVPHLDTGDFVIVLNAAKVKLTGKKLTDKSYYHHTGFPGGIKEFSAEKLLQKKPEELIRRAVWGMLPKGPLGRKMVKKLKIYASSEHDHSAQQPKTLEV